MAATTQKYASMLAPLTLKGGQTLRNRVVMGSSAYFPPRPSRRRARRAATGPTRAAPALTPRNPPLRAVHTGLEDSAGLPGGLKKLGSFLAARAAGGVGLIVTGGVAPNRQGAVAAFAGKLTAQYEMRAHRDVTSAVHEAGGKVAMQILHAGRYAYHPWAVVSRAAAS